VASEGISLVTGSMIFYGLAVFHGKRTRAGTAAGGAFFSVPMKAAVGELFNFFEAHLLAGVA